MPRELPLLLMVPIGSSFKKKMTVFVCSVEPVSTGVAVQIWMLEKRERCCESKRRVRSEVFVQLLNAGKVVQTDGLTFYNSSPTPTTGQMVAKL